MLQQQLGWTSVILDIYNLGVFALTPRIYCFESGVVYTGHTVLWCGMSSNSPVTLMKQGRGSLHNPSGCGF